MVVLPLLGLPARAMVNARPRSINLACRERRSKRPWVARLTSSRQAADAGCDQELAYRKSAIASSG